MLAMALRSSADMYRFRMRARFPSAATPPLPNMVRELGGSLSPLRCGSVENSSVDNNSVDNNTAGGSCQPYAQ